MNHFMNTEIYSNLIKICGAKNVSKSTKILKSYSKDLSFFPGKLPIYVVWPKTQKQIEKIIKLANTLNFSIVPVSSISGARHHGDTLPHKDNCVILDLSKMNKVVNIDKKNRVVMVEPGVTFSDLIPKLQKKGLRLLHPLHVRETKSVLTSALEREPITIPRYHWDTSDPLLCTGVVFGTGDPFRTGVAAGPGTLKQQKKSGQAQKNPMGPTQFSLFRVIQGAQGSLGIVTWATLKLELIPSIQRVFHLQSDNIQELLKFQQELLKYRLCDELLILNNLNLSCLVKQSSKEIYDLAKDLAKWNLIFVIAGRGKLAKDKIQYLEGDIKDVMNEQNLDISKRKSIINNNEIIQFLSQPDTIPWRLRLKGGYQDIFFITCFEKITDFISIIEKQISKDLGIYIQPINQGTSYHCEFDIFYNPNDKKASINLKDKFLNICTGLMDSGAFFNRPYGLWAKEVFKRHTDSTQTALKKVKKIFDPNNVLNPGVLCFDN